MASVRQRESRWTGLFRDRSGAQKSAGTFDTKREALKAARGAEALGYTTREPQTPYAAERRGHITIAGYGPKWLAGHRLEATSRESYAAMLKHIYRGLGNKTLHDLTPADVRAFFRGLEREGRLSGASVGHVMTVLREMCRTAVNDGLMGKDPTAGVKIASRRAREMRIVEPAEYGRLLMATPPAYRLVVRALTETGLRWGELQGLKAEDISDGQLSVRRVLIEVGGKCQVRDYPKTTRSHRTITISPDLAADLVAAGQRNPEGWCIRAARGGPLTRSNFRRIWKAALKAARLSGIRVHDLRHTHASWLLAHGADLVSVRDRLGHSDIRVTSRYLHTLKRDTDPCLDALNGALAQAA